MFKVILLGASGVGKTSIIKRYIDDTFEESLQKPSLGFDFLSKEIVREKKKVRLEIWDTAGQERFQAMAKMYYKDAHGVILDYDITDLESFDRMKEWLEEVEQNEKVLAKKIIVGTKSDIPEKRKISMFEAKKFATEKKLDWLECSSKTGEGINILFDTLIDKLLVAYDTEPGFRRLSLRSTVIDVDNSKDKKQNKESYKLTSKRHSKSSCCG